MASIEFDPEDYLYDVSTHDLEVELASRVTIKSKIIPSTNYYDWKIEIIKFLKDEFGIYNNEELLSEIENILK
jgi:hypothetical protein